MSEQEVPTFENLDLPTGAGVLKDAPDGLVTVDRGNFFEMKSLLEEQAKLTAQIIISKQAQANLEREIRGHVQRHVEIESAIGALRTKLGLSAEVAWIPDERRIGFVPEKKP